MRDIVLADTVFMAFTTRAFATGIPTVLAGTPVVSAYEDAGLTQITAGITLGVDHDGVVGLNMLTIVATGANGYEADKDYNLVITTGTVGGVSVVGEVVGQFSIQRAPVNWANVTDPTTAVDLSGTDIQLVDTTTTNTDMRGTDSALLAANINLSAGVVESNLLQMGGVFQSGTDLKDFADAGYDPATNKVQGVVLVDTTTVNTDMRGTDGVDTATMRGTDSAFLAASAPANFSALGISVGGAIDDVVLVATTTTNTDVTALNDISVADILTTQMTQSFAADGVAPTLAQALFLIQQMLGDFGIAGTTLTVREIDGVTTAATFTLDDGTNPTDITRTT